MIRAAGIYISSANSLERYLLLAVDMVRDWVKENVGKAARSCKKFGVSTSGKSEISNSVDTYETASRERFIFLCGGQDGNGQVWSTCEC
jgi:hypothetical protein